MGGIKANIKKGTRGKKKKGKMPEAFPDGRAGGRKKKEEKWARLYRK